MTTYNTGNPIGSTDPRDLSDNSENFDRAVNNISTATWLDRFGVSRVSLAAQLGYVGTGAGGAIESYAAGLVMGTYNTIILYSGEFYRPSASATLPYTTTATLPDVDSNLASVGDAVLRQDLASTGSGQGASLVSMQDGPTVEVAVNNRVIRVSSRTEMKAYDVPANYQFNLSEEGRSGSFVVKTGTPPADAQEGIYVVLTNGNYAERLNKLVLTAEMFGAVGNNAAIDTAAWIGLLSFAEFVIGKNGRTYVINDELQTGACKIWLNGSTLDFQLVGQKKLLTLLSDVHLSGGRLEQNGSAGGLAISGFQMPVYGVDSKNIELLDLHFGGTLGNQAAIGFYGDVNNHRIEGITFDSSVPFGQGVIYHWLCADGGLNASGANLTNHPRNISIKNVEGGTFTNAGALTSAVFLSGCYNVTVDNVYLDTSNRLITVYPGDYANEFANARDASFINDNIVITNPAIRVANVVGIHTTGKGILSANITDTNVSVINPQLRGNSTNSFGIFSSYSRGVKVFGAGKVWANQYNIALGESVKKFQMDGIEVTEGLNRGVSCGSGNAIDNEQIYITNCRIHNNNLANDSIESSSGIYLERTKSAFIRANTFGLIGGPEKQYRSVSVANTCNNIHLGGNHTYSAGSSIAYLGAGTQYAMNLWDDGGNSSDTANNFAGHVWYRITGFNNRQFTFDGLSGVPTTGTWAQGDRLYYRFAAAGGHIGAACTGAGTPGTWKTFGAISA
jgi:hypothetical protein